ncbi:MAG: cobalamin-dependent protein [Anaerolineae bacterium]|nr:cobalamin-dependent protein [Anaerolineae bacterium]
MDESILFSNELIDEFEHSLLVLDRISIKKMLGDPQGEIPPYRRVEELVIPALERIGEKWTTGKISLSQVYMSGKICEEMVDLILPPADPSRKDYPPMAIAVLEDYHFLGKRIVYSSLRASGFELLNYPRLDVEGLVQCVKKDKIEILFISVLMLPSALRVKELRSRLNQLTWKVKIGVGGAPFRFDDSLWQEVGADAVGKNAADAIPMVGKLIGG